MADDEKEGGETSARGSDWEVVSLTASAYAAAPGHVGFELPADDKGMELSKDEDESSQAMFMSDHFGFTPSEHVDLPIESNNSYIMEGVGNQSGSADGQSGEILNESAGEGTDTPEVLDEEERGRVNQTAENWNVGKMQSSLKGLSEADSLQGIQFFEEKGKNLSAHGEDFDWIEPIQHSGVEEEQNLFTAAKLGSFHAESDRSGPTVGDDSVVASDLLKGDQESEDLSQWSLDSPKLPKEHKNDEQGLPCEAWWKRRAAAFYAQAKEANTIWSVVVAAALMGLVILGQRWQQERWQFQQLKWQFSINDEAYCKNFADKDGKVWKGGGGRNPPLDAPHLVMTTPDIESLWPKSHPAKSQQLQSTSLSQSTVNTLNKRPTGNSPPNPTAPPALGLNQEVNSSNNPQAAMPWPAPAANASEDKFFDNYGFNPSCGQASGDHLEFESHRAVNLL